MKQPKVAFQGELGAFSQQAIQQLLGPGARPLACQRFDQVFEQLAAKKAHAAVIPIENTLHGSVHENYDLLLQHDVRIEAETNVRIVHNLVAAPGVPFRDLKEVYSHPVALNQCLNFFAANPAIRRVPYYDTAGAARMVVSENRRDAAAISSQLAAELYGVRILKRSIEDDRRNFTRFFLLSRTSSRPVASGPAEKTSIVFTVRNQPGSLFRAMSVFALRDISLAKIESRPLRGKPWEYRFYLDFLGDAREQAPANALRHLGEFCDSLKVLGSYSAR
ncbi:MAG: prephenate dehydratase [Bryobacteraceae bacterium]|nr:prephenate dehydratase [Bryobacteraceae bacterium]